MACTALANIVALSTRGLFIGCTRWVRREKKGKKSCNHEEIRSQCEASLDSFKMLMLLLTPCFYWNDAARNYASISHLVRSTDYCTQTQSSGMHYRKLMCMFLTCPVKGFLWLSTKYVRYWNLPPEGDQNALTTPLRSLCLLSLFTL